MKKSDKIYGGLGVSEASALALKSYEKDRGATSRGFSQPQLRIHRGNKRHASTVDCFSV